MARELCEFFGAFNEGERQTILNAIRFRESKALQAKTWVTWEAMYNIRLNKYGMLRQTWGQPRWFPTLDAMIHWYMTEGAAL